MSRFIPVDRQTDYLLPPSVDEWLPDGHLARFVVDVVEQLDLSTLTRRYMGRGSKAHHPAVLLSLLIYGYATEVVSSRKIERATYDSVAFRYLAANTHPDHDTLATFRRRFLPELEQLFVQVLLLAREMKLLKLGTIALDGQAQGQRQQAQGVVVWPCQEAGGTVQGRGESADRAGRVGGQGGRGRRHGYPRRDCPP